MSFPLTQISQSSTKRAYSQDGPKTYKRQKKSPMYRTPGVPVATRKAIRNAVGRARETKYNFRTIQEANLSTLALGEPFLYFWPEVRVGNRSYERVGNSIEPVKLDCNFILHNNSSQTVYVRAMVFRYKKTFVDAATLTNQFYEGILGQDQPAQGNIADIIRRPDKDAIDMMYDEVITLGYEAAGYASPNPRMCCRKMSFKPRVKRMIYQDADQDTPIKDQYFLAFAMARADNDENTGETVEMSNDLGMFYKD